MWEQLAISLGLAKDAKQEEILAALQKRDAEQRTQLDAVTGALAKRNMKLENGAVVDVAPAPQALDFTVKPTDDANTKALKERLAAAEQENAEAKKAKAEVTKNAQLGRIAEVKAMAQQLAKSGQIPPAVLADVEELLACEGAVQKLTLSADGQPSMSTLTDVGRKFEKVLAGLKSVVGPLLSQNAAGANATPKAEAEKKADEVLDRMGIKPAGKEAAAAK